MASFHHRLAARLSQSAPAVVSRVAYLKSIINDKSGQFEVSEKSPAGHEGESTSKPDAPEPAINQVEALMKREQESQAQKMKLVRAEIESLTPDVRAQLIDDFIAHASSNAMHKRVIEKLEEGAWTSSMVFAHLAVYYWKKTRGTDWSSF